MGDALDFLPGEARSQLGSGLRGGALADLLDILIRGSHALEKSKVEEAKSQGGVLGFLRRLLG